MNQLKLILIGIAIGFVISGSVILTWNAHKTIIDLCATTREIENDDQRSTYSRKYKKANF